MSEEKVMVARIKAVIEASEEAIASSTSKVDKINAVITAYEHIIKILEEQKK